MIRLLLLAATWCIGAAIYCSRRTVYRRDVPWFLSLAALAAIGAFLAWAWSR